MSQDRLVYLEGRLTYLENLFTKATHSDEITKLKKEVQVEVDKRQALERQLGNISAYLSSHTEYRDPEKSVLTNVQECVNDLEKKLEGTQKKLGEMDYELLTAKGNINSLNNKMNSYSEDVSELGEFLRSHKAKNDFDTPHEAAMRLLREWVIIRDYLDKLGHLPDTDGLNVRVIETINRLQYETESMKKFTDKQRRDQDPNKGVDLVDAIESLVRRVEDLLVNKVKD